MQIKIEKLRQKDLPAFYAVFKRSLFKDFREYSPKMATFKWKQHRKNHLMRWVKDGSEVVFLAKDKDGKVVGFLTTDAVFGGVAYCNWLIVDRQFQGQGIGGRILQFWEKWAKKNQAHMLDLTCDKRNLSFYRKFGFKRYGFMKEGYCNESNYLLAKKIGRWNPKNLE
jgi:ribosomal protein S18 acetylase RimI-like enzyme